MLKRSKKSQYFETTIHSKIVYKQLKRSKKSQYFETFLTKRI